MNTASSCSCSQGLAIDPSCPQHSTSAARTPFTRTNSDQSDSSVYQNTNSDSSSVTTPTYPTSRPTSSSSFDRRLSSGRGPRCPRHAFSNMTDCSCLVTPSLEESESDRRKSTSTEASSSPSRVRSRTFTDPFTLLPRSSWNLYKDLADNETAHIQLANELSSLRLSQGCELAPSLGYGCRPDSDETFASGVLRPIRSVVNKFYFSEGGSGPVPRYAVEAPTDVETRNVVVFFQKTHIDDEVDEDHTKRRISAWATMWRDHVRGMMAARAGQVETCAPVPVIEVRQSGRFYLYFIVDTGSEALVLDRRIRIGDTNSMQGLCRLRNASVYLSSWKRDVYMPWIKGVTERAQVTIKLEPDT